MRGQGFGGGGLLRSVRNSPNLRIYLAGHGLSVIGTWVQRVAQDWLVLSLTQDARALGVSVAAQFAPMLVLAPYGGLLVDRLDRRRTLVATQALSALLAVVLAVITITEVVELWSVLAIALGLGLVTVVDVPARQAFVASMVEPRDYANAQALASSVNNAGRLVGPAIAGLLIAGVGVGTAFIVNAASFIGVIAGLALLDTSRLRPSPRAPRRPGQVAEGARYVWRHPELRGTLLLVGLVAVFGQNFRVVLPLLATEVHAGNAQTYGWMTSAIGLGALGGAVLSARVQVPTLAMLTLTSAAFGIANLLGAVTPLLSLVLLVLVAVGTTNFVFNTLARSLLLLHSEPELHGRVMALHGQVFLGSTPIGGPLVGWMCDAWGASAGLGVAGGTALVAAAALALRGRRRRGRPSPPARGLPEPHP